MAENENAKTREQTDYRAAAAPLGTNREAGSMGGHPPADSPGPVPGSRRFGWGAVAGGLALATAWLGRRLYTRRR